MNIRALIYSLLLSVGVSFSFGVALAGDHETAAEKIARAVKAAPSDITDNATIVDLDGTVLRQGTNGWTCMPGVSRGPGNNYPMCNDAVWMAWMKAAAAGESFSTDVIGYSYMLAGDAPVSNDDPAETDPSKGTWVTEGAHLMMLLPNKDMMADLPRDPSLGGPYVMWDKTPLAHVMVPIDAKTE
jgi:hypothetical protein